MKTIYACTWMEKTSCVDHFDKGCETRTTGEINEPVGITADSLKDLIQAIGEYYGIEIDEVFLSDSTADNERVIGYNRFECEDGSEPDESELAEWKAGDLKLYLCDYTFAIEKRTVSGISYDEFKDAGIRTH